MLKSAASSNVPTLEERSSCRSSTSAGFGTWSWCIRVRQHILVWSEFWCHYFVGTSRPRPFEKLGLSSHQNGPNQKTSQNELICIDLDWKQNKQKTNLEQQGKRPHKYLYWCVCPGSQHYYWQSSSSVVQSTTWSCPVRLWLFPHVLCVWSVCCW